MLRVFGDCEGKQKLQTGSRQKCGIWLENVSCFKFIFIVNAILERFHTKTPVLFIHYCVRNHLKLSGLKFNFCFHNSCGSGNGLDSTQRFSHGVFHAVAVRGWLELESSGKLLARISGGW